ncbi:MAG: hypothetical protein EOO27_22255 [Comamonadaceae bacterium]|nr:MAG: hypothetical protein EOO27_22255 [Comamonadaceae bacterium]
MSRSNHPAIRAVLRTQPDGATITEIVGTTGIKDETIYQALRAMPDAYIDRWRAARSGSKRYLAVWCVVDVPADCPHPEVVA